MEPNDEGDFCFLQGFLMILSQISIVICSTLLGFYTKQSIQLSRSRKVDLLVKEDFFIFSLVILSLLPLVYLFLPEMLLV